jgi:predicted nucleotidyltransferase
VGKSRAEVIPAARALSRWLTKARIPHVFIGGVAVAFAGRPRTTRDVDLVVLLGDHSWDSFLRAAAGSGFVPRIPGAAAFARRSRVFLLRHERSGVDVDISAGALPFEEETIRRAREVIFGRGKIRVATPEDLIVMKLVASRPRDIADVEEMIAANPNLDRRRVRRIVRQFSKLLDMPEMLERLEALLGKRRRR